VDCDLLQHGLLKSSFIPGKAQRELRELVSYRRSLVGEKSRELNRLQKMLEGGNIKLSGTISNVNGKTGRNILNALVRGEIINQERLAELIVSRVKADPKQLLDDLQGILTPLQRKMIGVVLKHIDELDRHIADLDEEIDSNMSDGDKARTALLDSIPGIAEDSAKTILAIIGTDMSRFPTANHLCSWAGVAPGNNESAEKRLSGRSTKGNKVLKSTLVQCAHSAVMVKSSFFHAQYQRLSIRRGKKRAIVAVAHSMLIAIYHILKNGETFRDLGADYYFQFNRERKVNALLHKLHQLAGTSSTMLLLPDFFSRSFFIGVFCAFFDGYMCLVSKKKRYRFQTFQKKCSEAVPLLLMVGLVGLEPMTSTMSTVDKIHKIVYLCKFRILS